ncbi:MAG: Fic family protein [Luteibaculaceae bacterium]|jgi:Fic family protein
MAFTPQFSISAVLSQSLMDIESSRQAVSSLPITIQLLKSLRESARLSATHYSTQIEGNCLTQDQVKEVMLGGTFPNRERDEEEVKNYFLALNYVDSLVETSKTPIEEKQIQTIHGLVYKGQKKPSKYRDGQNVIKESSTGRIIYMPPEATDVPGLMNQLLQWLEKQIKLGELPIPIIAAICHYQFATIHPYYDGNGRTARLLTNLILHKSGYGLKGIYSLEEYYARDLQRYYEALRIGNSHNYYFGRAEADISNWINYFCKGMADAFAKVRSKASEEALLNHTKRDQASLLRELDQRQKQILSLFKETRFVTTRDVAEKLGIHIRTSLNLCNTWVESGFILTLGNANKSRKYELAKKWDVLL